MKVSDYIASFLQRASVNKVFGYIGGFNQDIVDSMHLHNIEFILNYHEQASAFAANAHALVTHQVAVITSSGAPSTCNLIPGIANAYFDSVPCVFIVGSPHTLAVRKNKNLRQNAFEEIDIISMVSDITKFAKKIESPNDIRYYLEKAFYMADEGRKGPVVLDIPYDIARSKIVIDNLIAFTEHKAISYDAIDANNIFGLLQNAKKPLILLGGGARGNNSKKQLLTMLSKVKIPVVASLCGLDALPHDHPCFVGFIGDYGNRYANFSLANCDWLLILGSRLDERQLGGYRTQLASGCKVIRVDIDKSELGRKFSETISLYSSVENFLEQINKVPFINYNCQKWIDVINKWKKRYLSYDLNMRDVNANNFLHHLSNYLPDNVIVCADVGQHQMSVAQSISLNKNKKLLNSGGYGSMGFSLPAATGAAYATNKKVCILSINGDGGLQMNIQELQTIKRDELPIKIIVLNNNCLGMIRRLQEKMFNNRTFVSVTGYSAPDYSAIAKAYKINYLKIDSPDKYELVKDYISSIEPVFIEVILPQNMQNNPEPGICIDMQTPLLSNIEYKKIKEECDFYE